MPETYCPEEYIPWLLARDYGFFPMPDTFSEIWDLGSDEYNITLANTTHKANLLIEFDNDRSP